MRKTCIFALSAFTIIVLFVVVYACRAYIFNCGFCGSRAYGVKLGTFDIRYDSIIPSNRVMTITFNGYNEKDKTVVFIQHAGETNATFSIVNGTDVLFNVNNSLN